MGRLPRQFTCLVDSDTMATLPSCSHLHSQAKQLAYNVSEYFLKENGGPFDDVSKAICRTAAATSLSKSRIEAIRREAKTNEENNTPNFTSAQKRKRAKPATDFFDNFNEDVLRRTVLRFYERKEIPTVEKIHAEIVNNLSYPGGRETLRKILKKIGFRYARVDGRRFLMEHSDVTYARSKFLREMARLSSNDKNIVYLHKTWMNRY